MSSITSFFIALLCIAVVYSDQLYDSGVYGWGNGRDSALSLPLNSIIKKPTYIQSLKNLNVVQVAASDSYSFVLTDEKEGGEVYAFGRAGPYGNLGDNRGGSHIVDQPTLIPELKNIKQISISTFHGLALRSDGKVLSWGDGNDGKLGLGMGFDHAKLKPTETLLENITLISAGEKHSLFLTLSGKVYGCGSNQVNQVGHFSDRTLMFPIFVALNPPTTIIKLITAGRSFSMAVDLDNKVWGWGNLTAFGITANIAPAQLGTFNDLIGKINKKIVDIQAKDHVMIILEDGTLISAGDDTDGKLCLGAYGMTPVDLRKVEPTVSHIGGVSSVSLGPSHSIIITKSGKIYACGTTLDGRLGDDSSSPPPFKSVPELIASFQMGSDETVRPAHASAGFSHSLLVNLIPLSEFIQSDSCPLSHPFKCPLSKLCSHTLSSCINEHNQCTSNVRDHFHCVGLSTANKCVSSPQLCLDKVKCNDTTIPCWNGECVKDISECSMVPSCPFDNPKRCRLECAKSGTVCQGNNCPDGTELCAAGYCGQKGVACNDFNGCPIDQLRCPNGTCVNKLEECIKCDSNNPNLNLCFDGSCSAICNNNPPSFKKVIKTTITVAKSATNPYSLYSTEEGIPPCSVQFSGFPGDETRVDISPVSDGRIMKIPKQSQYDSIYQKIVSMMVRINPGKDGAKKMNLACNILSFPTSYRTTGCLATLSSDNKISCIGSPSVSRTEKAIVWTTEGVDLTDNIYFYLSGDLKSSQEPAKKSVGTAFIAISMIIIVAIIIISIWKKNQGDTTDEKEKFLRDEENPRTDVQLDEIDQRERRQD